MAAFAHPRTQADAAARELYARYYPPVYRYARSRLRTSEDAEDAAQTTFLRAFVALQRGVVPESEPAWLFTIAHNVCVTSQLASARRGRVEMAVPVESASPERPDDLIGLQDALAEMPPRLRQAFLLREWQGLSYAEIAERLDTTKPAVETLIFRARRFLARQLAPFAFPVVWRLLKAGAVVVAVTGGTAGAVHQRPPAPAPAPAQEPPSAHVERPLAPTPPVGAGRAEVTPTRERPAEPASPPETAPSLPAPAPQPAPPLVEQARQPAEPPTAPLPAVPAVPAPLPLPLPEAPPLPVLPVEVLPDPPALPPLPEAPALPEVPTLPEPPPLP